MRSVVLVLHRVAWPRPSPAAGPVRTAPATRSRRPVLPPRAAASTDRAAASAPASRRRPARGLRSPPPAARR